jgi:predicted ArsR family transcriptional regulator
MKTRARVIELLRAGQQTVDQLAVSLGVTANAVRMHLDGLMREGAVRQAGVLRSGTAGKPAAIYELSPDAEVARSRAYAPILTSLLATLAEKLSPRDLEAQLRASGRRLGRSQPHADGALTERAAAASALLNHLGAVTTIEEAGGAVILHGIACPLALAVGAEPKVCAAVEELVSTVTGAATRQQCKHQPRPACSFVLTEHAAA